MKKIMLGIFVVCLITATQIEMKAMAEPTVDRGTATGSVVEINTSKFPDKYFRKYVSKKYDKNKDNVLDKKEIKKATRFYWDYDYSSKIASLKGIEYLTSLETIKKHSLQVTKIKTMDLRKLTKLEEIVWTGDNVKKVKLGKKNKKLYYVNYKFGGLKSISLSPNIRELQLGSNCLTKINVSKCKKLWKCSLFDNKLEKLNVKKNKKLYWLDVSETRLKHINIKNNRKLVYFDISSKNLKKINVSKNKKLVHLEVCDSKIKKINLKHNKKLKVIWLAGNKLEHIDLSHNKDLRKLYIDFNKLKELKLTNKKLWYLQCGFNKMTRLDLTKCKRLKELECPECKLTSLNITGLKKLKVIECDRNPITYLDVRKCTKLYDLDCSKTKISFLDVRHLKKLEWLFVPSNCKVLKRKKQKMVFVKQK